MFALPCVRISTDKSIEFTNGSIISLPPELTGNQRLSMYQRLTKPGWSKTIFEYDCFTHKSDTEEIYIFPALFTTTTKPKKKFQNYVAGLNKSAVETYAENLFAREKIIQEESEENLSMITHDLRRLSTAIYHQAVELRDLTRSSAAKPLNLQRIQNLIGNIIASQTMLRLRTDVLDFRIDRLDVYPDEEIEVHKKVLKVVRCFRPWADHRNVHIDLRGETFAKILGPNIFEILIYILLDNALKYSPNNETISVEIAEGSQNIRVRVVSTGPKIETTEVDKVFNKRFRGDAALKTQLSGSGIGLFVANQISKQFGGNIVAKVLKDDITRYDIPYNRVAFTIIIPMFSKTLF